MPNETYAVYRHRKNRDLRLTLKKGAPLPAEAKKDDWELKRVFTDAELGKEILQDINKKGFSLIERKVKFTETEGVVPPPNRGRSSRN